MQIRKIRKNDHAAIIKIAKALPQWFTKRGISMIKYALKRQPGIVATGKGNVVGFLTYRMWKNMAEITWIGVDPKSRRKGIGTLLVTELESVSKGKDIKKIKVSTLANTARHRPYAETRKFYKNMGFKTSGIDKNFYPDGGDREVMAKNL